MTLVEGPNCPHPPGHLGDEVGVVSSSMAVRSDASPPFRECDELSVLSGEIGLPLQAERLFQQEVPPLLRIAVVAPELVVDIERDDIDYVITRIDGDGIDLIAS